MSLMYAQMGMAVGQAFFNHGAAKTQARLQEAEQKYRNTMSALAAAENYNTITANEISVRDSAMRAAEAIQLQALQDSASAEAGAAAAGVRGGAVSATMRGIQRSRMQASEALRSRMIGQSRASHQERRGVALAQVYNKDISVISKPSTASALLGLGMNLIDVYDSHQPAGQSALDLGMNRWNQRG